MPPFSKELWEEGAQFKSFKLVKEGKFDEEGVTAALNEPGKYPGCSGTRTLRDVGLRMGQADLRTFRTYTPKSQPVIAELFLSNSSSTSKVSRLLTFTCAPSCTPPRRPFAICSVR